MRSGRLDDVAALRLGGYRVLHVAEVVRGGVGTHLRTIIPAQRSCLGDDMVLGLYPQRFAADMTGVFAAPCLAPWSGRGPYSLFKFGLAISRAVRRMRPDLVHAHSTFAGVLVRLAIWRLPRRLRPKVVYCAHGWSFRMETNRVRRRVFIGVERLLLPLTDGVVDISHDEASAAAEVGLRPARQVTILHGLTDCMQPTDPEPHRGLVLLFVGRFDVQKGLDILIQALGRMKRNDVTLHVVGEAVVPGQAATLALDDPRITVHGWLPPSSVAMLYEQADVLVVPSRWEGFGYVVLEAMRAGRAVFAARRGGLPELVVDGQTGRLFDPAQPDTLARMIDAADVNELHTMGRRARRRFLDHFTAERSNTALLGFYRTIICPSSRMPDSASTSVSRANQAVGGL